MVFKRYFILLFLFSSLTSLAWAQEENRIIGVGAVQAEPQEETDTIPDEMDIDDPELDNIISLRDQFEKQNEQYSVPVSPSENLLRFVDKDEVEISEEAFYWAHLVRDASTVFDSNVTFKDTIIVNPLFLPFVFKGKLLSDTVTYYNKDAWINKVDIPQPFIKDTLFQAQVLRQEIEDNMSKYVETNHPQSIRYSLRDLPQNKVVAKTIKKPTYQPEMIKVESNADFNEVDALVKFIPERRYWTSHFESSLQFAQNYISPNWYKGGVSTLNLTNRELFTYNYNKDKVKFTNTLEIKNNLYTAPKDTLRDYKVGDDVARIYSNFGYKAFSNWYYTLDMEFKTQIFSSFAENQDLKLSGLLAPFSVNVGLGMKYDLNKVYNKHKSLVLSANIAPLAYTFVYTIDKDIDLSRHFQKKATDETYPHQQSLFGSTINATMTFNINRNVSWYSRLNYNTNYQRIQVEFENRLTMAISRFFSTDISMNLRFDDCITKNKDFDTYLQINELLSFGFNYKW